MDSGENQLGLNHLLINASTKMNQLKKSSIKTVELWNSSNQTEHGNSSTIQSHRMGLMD